MTEVPDGELAEHLGEILHRAEAGEELVVTIDGRPVARLGPVPDLRPIVDRPATMSWDDFWAWRQQARHDPSFAADIRELVGDETTDDLKW